MKRALLVILAMSLTACSSKTSWTEDVVLSSGQTITIERKVRILRVLLAEGSGSVQEQWINYGSLTVEWHTKNLLELPLSFDLIDGTPYLATRVGDICTLPEGGIQGLRILAWHNKRWTDVPMEKAPMSTLKYNLHRDFQGINSSDDTHTHQSVNTKRVGWRGASRFGADPHQGEPLMQWHVLLKRPIRPC